MSKVLNRKLFKKKYVQGFQAGGIVSLKKGGEASDEPNFFQKYILGPKTGGLDVGQQRQVMGDFLLGPRSQELIKQRKTKEDPESALIGVKPPMPGQTVAEKKDVPLYDFPEKKEPKKLGADDVPKNQIASAAYTSGNKVIDKKFQEYEEKNFNQKVTPQKPKDETPDDPSEVATKKQLRNIMDEIAAERKEGFGVNVPLMKLALGLMKGTTTQPGLAGVAQIFGQAGEGALDAFLEQEKQRKDADIDLMELATKLKISQDEVAARKYAVDKQAELYGLKKFDPAAKAEAEASYDRVLTSYQGVNKVLELLQNPDQISTVDQIASDLQGVAESVFGYIPDKTPAPRQIQQIITHLQLNLTDLLKDLKPVSKNELALLQRNIGELGYFKSPQDLKNKMQTLKVLLEKSLARAQSSYDYNFSSPFGAGSIGNFSNRSGLSIDEHINKKSSKDETKK